MGTYSLIYGIGYLRTERSCAVRTATIPAYIGCVLGRTSARQVSNVRGLGSMTARWPDDLMKFTDGIASVCLSGNWVLGSEYWVSVEGCGVVEGWMGEMVDGGVVGLYIFLDILWTYS